MSLALTQAAQQFENHGRFVLQAMELCKWFTTYAPVMRRGEGMFFASTSILERKFRDGVEIWSGQVEGDDYSKWFLSTSSVCALLDALLQVRDAVGRVCGTLDEASGHLHEGFDSLDELVKVVTAAQIWANWMMAALHVLAEMQGQYPLEELPPRPCSQVAAARRSYLAWWQQRRPGEDVVPNWGAPIACGDPAVRWELPQPDVPYSPDGTVSSESAPGSEVDPWESDPEEYPGSRRSRSSSV
ncbi:hypothetical protein FRC06_006785 [Ceratobasidium sp. 370]|nr:hypothetical protein FRC06_006785 [Ceratobasidium sp. 370]